MPQLRFSIRYLLALIFPALFTAVITVLMCVAFAAIIFSGELSIYLPTGIGIIVSGAVFVGVIAGLFGGAKRVVFQPDDDTAPIYAAMVAAVSLVLPAGLAPAEKLSLVLVSIAVATMLSGMALALIGLLKAGSVIEYLPYSVMGGYFAAAGLLLVVGALRVISQLPLESIQEASLLAVEYWIPTLASVAIAAVLFLLRNRIAGSLLMPLVTVLSIALFYGLSYALGYSVDDLSAGGWLIGPFPVEQVNLFHPVVAPLARDFTWASLMPGVGSMVVIVLLSVMSLLLTISGLSLLSKEDFEVNRELKVAGLANIGGGLFGGLVAVPSLSLTAMATDMGAPKTRALSILAAAIVALLFIFCIQFIGYLPRVVIAGLLLNLGFGFLYTWLIEAKSQYSIQEYMVIPIIVVVASIFGFLQGVLVGLLAAVILFVVKYSQINIIRFEGDGAKFRSNVERSENEHLALKQHSAEILAIGLQGYLFFGTAGSIYTRVKRAINEPKSRIRYVVLDFAQVTGVDASAGLNFERLSQLVTLSQIHLVVAGLEEGLKAPLTSTGLDVSSAAYVSFMPDFDFALEWCEDDLLQGRGRIEEETTFLKRLEKDNVNSYQTFLSYLKILDVAQDQVLTEQGDASTELFLLDDTSASAYIVDELGHRLRVRRTGAGTVYGEIGFFLGTPRTASVVADKPGRVFVLTKEALARLQLEQPGLAARFQEYLVTLSVERLYLTTQTLKTVLR